MTVSTILRRSGSYLALAGCLLLTLAPLGLLAQEADRLTPKSAIQAFTELSEALDHEAGSTWGIPLNGPILIVDGSTRQYIANVPPMTPHAFEPIDDVFVGTLPTDMTIANTSLDWAGRNWAMILWPLPETPEKRRVLLAHESWHRIQNQIPIAASGDANSHLDSFTGRLWIRMEWLALAKALQSQDSDRQLAIQEALLFRQLRRQRFPDCDASENRMELHEGLAEYTGVKIGAGHNAIPYTILTLNQRPDRLKSFCRSFAYLSGPAYGLLLDQVSNTWRKQLQPDSDLGELTRVAYHIQQPSIDETSARKRIETNHWTSVLVAETQRETERLGEQKKGIQKFVDGPVVILPFKQIQMSFDPNQNTPLENYGTIYGNLVVVTDWGKLESTGQALISNDFARIVVPIAQSSTPIPTQGEDWKLNLAPGWVLQPADRAGDWILREIP